MYIMNQVNLFCLVNAVCYLKLFLMLAHSLIDQKVEIAIKSGYAF